MKLQKFSQDFHVPIEFVEEFWNSFDVTPVCKNLSLTSFQVCGNRNPSRKAGYLQKVATLSCFILSSRRIELQTLPHGRIQHGKNGDMFREYDVPPFSVTTKETQQMILSDSCTKQVTLIVYFYFYQIFKLSETIEI